MLAALQLLVQTSKSAPALKKVPEFAFDTVELSRQFMVNRFLGLYNNLLNVWNSTTSTSHDVMVAGQPLLNLINDLDTLLYTNQNFLLSTWIEDAKQWAHGNASYATYLEYQARNQITLWGPDGEINDYASKQWAGVVGEYYGARWKSFVSTLVDTKVTGQPYNATQVKQTMLNIGGTFGLKTWGVASGETWGTKGDTFAVVDHILKQWA